MSQSKKLSLAIAGLLTIIGGYFGLRIYFLQAHLQHALTQADLAQAAAEKQDFKLVSDYIHEIATDANSAAAISRDPLLSILYVLPGISDTWSAVAAVSQATAEIADTAEPTFRFSLVLKTDLDKNGTIEGKTVRALRDAYMPLEAAIEDASHKLASLDVDNLSFGVGPKVAKLQLLLSDAEKLTHNAGDYVKAFASVTGTEGDNYWLIATQNLAEARGTGGLFGSYAVLRNNNGKISLHDSGSDKDAMDAGPIDNRSLSREMSAFYGIDRDLWLDFNVSAHVPLSGQIIYDTWLQNKKIALSGVLFIGQGGLRHIIASTGPVKVANKQIEANNVAEYMAKTVYADFVDVKAKNSFVQKLMKSVFSKLVKGNFDLKAALESFKDETTGDRVSVWSADPEAQKANEAQGIASVVSEDAGSNVWVSVNNAGGNKLDAYLKVTIKFEQGKCGSFTKDGIEGRESKLVIGVKNTAPKRGLPAYVTPRLDLPAGVPYPKGASRDLISVYAPVGATENGFFRDGKQTTAAFGFENSHPIFMFDVNLLPGKSTELEVNFVEPVTNAKGRALQSVPRLVPPVMFNKVETEIAPGAFCEVKQ